MKLHIMQVIDFLASFVTSWLNSSHRCIKRTILDMFYLTACGLLHKQHADLYSNIFMTWIISRKVSSTLTWLIFEVEDGHDVVSEIKHRKHSHFGESLGNIAQIKNCQHVHVAGLSCVSVLFRLRSLEDPPKPGPQTVRHSKPPPPLPHPPYGLDCERLWHSSPPINITHLHGLCINVIIICAQCQLLRFFRALQLKNKRLALLSSSRSSLSRAIRRCWGFTAALRRSRREINI